MEKIKMVKNKTSIVVVVIVAVLLIWGLIGSFQVAEIGNTCDLGINSAGSVFCWKWHRNVVGNVQDKFDDLLKK
jgi:hypothetical protein